MRIDDIKPYEKNARDNEKAIPVVAESIKEFGFKGQIILESPDNPVIVAGHTRWAACKLLGWEEIPDEHIAYCDDLTEEQIRAFRLADNKTGEVAKWIPTLIQHEVKSIGKIDMSKYGFDFKSKTLERGFEALRTSHATKLDIVNADDCAGKWGMPIIEAVDVKPTGLIPFNYCKTAKGADYGKYVHFAIDDYQFERVWNRPEQYIELLQRFDGVIAPDFSVYLDMPKPAQIWNVFRSLALAQVWSRAGITVVPNLTWGNRDTYGFCFEGIPKHSTVFVSTVGCHSEEAREFFADGIEAAIKACKPSRVLLYGGEMEIDWQGIETVSYKANTAFNNQ